MKSQEKTISNYVLLFLSKIRSLSKHIAATLLIVFVISLLSIFKNRIEYEEMSTRILVGNRREQIFEIFSRNEDYVIDLDRSKGYLFYCPYSIHSLIFDEKDILTDHLMISTNANFNPIIIKNPNYRTRLINNGNEFCTKETSKIEAVSGKDIPLTCRYSGHHAIDFFQTGIFLNVGYGIEDKNSTPESETNENLYFNAHINSKTGSTDSFYYLRDYFERSNNKVISRDCFQKNVSLFSLISQKLNF